MPLKSFVLLIYVLFTSQIILAQGIRGHIYDEGNNALAFATIYIEELSNGTSANADAYFELKIKPGTYTVHFKFIGYETQVKTITVEDGFTQINIFLKPQVLLLNEVTTSAKATDPANWMMRRAIAKSSYNRQLIDGYTAQVYVKGKGRITDIPFYLKGAFKREGIDTTTQIITESLSNVSFKRPNQFSEKVLSVYASKKTDFNASPMPYISSSFYQDEVAGAISPLSTKAFQYYKFKHLGAFMDGDNLINRISVTPKVKAPNVFTGEIQLIEEDWAIYNLDLSTQIEYGIKFKVKQVYQLISDVVWMPITHQIEVKGELMGVDFIFEYLASVSDYNVQLNPALPKRITIVEKPNRKSDAQDESKQRINSIAELNKSNKDSAVFSINELPEIMGDYENKQRDSLNELDILSVYNFEFDSAAYTQDSAFWDTIRPIPLSENESKGYRKIDSLSIIQEAESLADSVKNKNQSTFQITDILTGGHYALDSLRKNQFIIYNALLGTQFNTVDGLNITYNLGFKSYLPSKINKDLADEVDYSFFSRPYLLVKPTFRYAFARNKFDSKVLFRFKSATAKVDILGGRYVQQINNAPPLTPLMNTSFTLMWEQNLMKIYDRKFLDINYENTFSSKFRVTSKVGFEERHQLYNTNEYSFFDWERTFTPNLPQNVNKFDSFDGQKALTASFEAFYKPFVKYIIRNNNKLPVRLNSSEFSFAYHVGVPDLFGSEVNFSRVELGYKDQYDFGAKGTSFLNVKVGGFLNNKTLGFMDYAHFPGNRSFITQADPVASYRLLDYYFYSTDDYYSQVFLFHKFRKFFVTQIPATRFLGLKEGFFVNYLLTNSSNNYSEIGYSLEGILKFFRIEVATQYEDFKYKGWGIRVGVSTSLGGSISISTED